MLEDTRQEIGRLESIFLEIIDDPTKKEVLLYPICYCQLVRKENSFEIDLGKLIGCANRTFHTFRGRWQDVLLELDLFQFLTPKGDVLLGKDILRISSPDGMKVSFLPEYREIFYEVYSKFLKYWTVLSKVSSYSKRNTPAEAIYLASIIFNEELYAETLHFSSLQRLRFPYEDIFFSALIDLSEFYIKVNERKDFDISLLERSLAKFQRLKGIYYGVNVGKLRKDTENLIREVERGRKYFVIKISFSGGKGQGRGFIRRFFSKLARKIREIGGRRWTLMNSGTAYFSFTEIYWRRQSGQQTLA